MTETKTRGGALVPEGTNLAVGSRARRVIRPKEVTYRTGLGRVTTWRKASDPDDDFPVPVQLIGNLIGWFEDEIDAWLESRPRVHWASEKTTDAEATDTGHEPSLPDEVA